MTSNTSNNYFINWGLLGSFLLFVTFSGLLYFATHIMIPLFHDLVGLPSILGWFIFGAILVFGPAFVLTLVLLKMDGYQISERSTWVQRLGFRQLCRSDVRILAEGFIITLTGTLVIVGLLNRILGVISFHPTFMKYGGVGPGTYWYLIVWLVFFFFNIIGEEVLWRGYLQPYQEKYLGNYTILFHGVLYFIFHLPFGFPLLYTLIPLLFAIPYVKRKSGNTFLGVILHGSINGIGFLAISFGMI